MARYSFSIITREQQQCLNYSGFTDDFELELPAMTYMWGIDQSSSNSGFYLTNTQNTFHIIGELSPTESNRHLFYAEMRKFFTILLTKAKIRLFISEKVAQVKGKGYYSSNKLQELKGVIEQWAMDIPCLRDIEDPSWIDDIGTSSWRSAIIDKSKGTGRFNKKTSVVEDLCDTFPELKIYRSRCRTNDFDAFEACGILHGYVLKNFSTNNTLQLIAGDSSYKGHIYTFLKVVPRNKPLVLAELEGYLNISIMKNGVRHLSYNDKYSLFQNYRMAGSRHPITVTTVEDLQTRLALQWQFGLPMTDDKLVVFIVRKNAIHGSDLELIKTDFHYDMYI